MENYILERAEALYPFTFELHKEIAENPEISWQEFRTTERVASAFDRFGISYRRTKRGTGLIAEIAGVDPDSRTVILRFEIDQLPVSCQGEKIVKSKIPGVSAACGHSAHTAIGTTCAAILKELQPRLRGRVVIMVQPAEEVVDDPGCKYMIEHEGILDYPNIVGAFALHVTPSFRAGDVHIRPGEFMASVSEFTAVFKGRTAHIQHIGQNSIQAAADFIVAARVIESQHTQPLMPRLITPARIHSNTWNNKVANLVPETTEVTMAFRTFNEEYRLKVVELLTKIARNTADNHGCAVENTVRHGIPPVKNEPELTARAEALLVQLFGRARVKEAQYRFGGDDFSLLSQKISCVFLRLGSGGAPEFEYELHDEHFQVNPACLSTGVAALTYLVAKTLEIHENT